MAASDHLSPQQFPRMAVSQLRRLRSVEGGRVADRLPDKHADIQETAPYAGAHWDAMRGAIRNGTIDPVHVDVKRGLPDSHEMRYRMPVMGDGHHRVALAEEMGVQSLPVTNDKELTARHGTGEEWRDERWRRRPDLQ